MKILIAVPTFENISPDTFKSIYNLDKGGHECLFEFVRGYDCARARNNIVSLALNKKCDYVLMVDNDVTLPPDALVNLLEEPREVCLGYYAHRPFDNQYTGKTNACRLGEFNYTQMIPGRELHALAENGVNKIEIHGGGMGCAMIRMDVFGKIPYPWYEWINYKNGEVLSEDLSFCEKCKGANIKIYTDTRVGCGHLMRHIQWPD